MTSPGRTASLARIVFCEFVEDCGSGVMKSVNIDSSSSWISTFTGEARSQAILPSKWCRSSRVSGPPASYGS